MIGEPISQSSVHESELHHCEIFVDDAPSLAHYLQTAYGFTIAASSGTESGVADAASILLVHGDVRMVLTSAFVPEHRATRFVQAHGYGIGTIAVRCADAAYEYRQTIERGAISVQPPTTYSATGGAFIIAEVLAIGDMVHRFVQIVDDPLEFLPGLRPVADCVDRGLVSALDHFAICVSAGEFGAITESLCRIFGYRQVFAEDVSFGDQVMVSRVLQSSRGGVTLVVVASSLGRPAKQLENFLQWHGGSGVQHLAFRTDDIIKAVQDLQASGVQFLQTPASYYNLLRQRISDLGEDLNTLHELNILADCDHWGHLLQVFTRSPHVRRTLFFELIERRSARTFGSANIRALYEAVQQDQQLLGLVP